MKAPESRALTGALRGAGLALGAPLGLLVVRALQRGDLSPQGAWLDARGEAWTYLYVALSTVVVFALFGFALGRQADRLYALSHRDPLTSLYNRRALEERLLQEVIAAARSRRPLSLLLLDLDGLKARNDRFGHKAGDLALVALAAAIRDGSRQSDVAARWGGDEFALLAPDTGRAEAGALAERIRALTEAQGDGLSVSVGIATLEGGGGAVEPETLVRAADAALYAAKRGGRNRVVLAETA